MKYMGSKARFAKEILPIVLNGRTTDQWYVEPFAGGMNMIDKVEGLRLANDINYYLIEFWKKATNGWMPKFDYSKEEYQFIQKNKDINPAETGYVGICCSYSGKWFGRYAGMSNTKQGVRDYRKEAFENVAKQIPNLKGVVFKSGSYETLELPANSIIYCDIPYQGTYSEIEGYSSKTFDYDIFWNWVRAKGKEGHKIYISEYNAPSDFECIWSKEAKSSLSANGEVGGSKISIEKLFTIKTNEIQQHKPQMELF